MHFCRKKVFAKEENSHKLQLPSSVNPTWNCIRSASHLSPQVVQLGEKLDYASQLGYRNPDRQMFRRCYPRWRSHATLVFTAASYWGKHSYNQTVVAHINRQWGARSPMLLNAAENPFGCILYRLNTLHIAQIEVLHMYLKNPVIYPHLELGNASISYRTSIINQSIILIIRKRCKVSKQDLKKSLFQAKREK